MAIEEYVLKGCRNRTVLEAYRERYVILASNAADKHAALPTHRSARLNFEQLPYLAGLEDDFAWEVRDAWNSRIITPEAKCYLLASIAGMISPRAVTFRDQLAAEGIDLMDAFSVGLAFKGMSDAVSVTWRERMYLEKPNAVLRSLNAQNNDTRSWEMRLALYSRTGLARSFEIKSRVRHLLDSITGSDTEIAWNWREEFYADYTDDVIESLAGLDNERATAMRKTYLSADHRDKRPLLKSLVGAGSSASTWLCQQVFDDKYVKDFFIKRFGNVLAHRDDELSWSLRREYVEEQRRSGWKDSETNLFLADSLQGIDTDEAYDIREQIIKADNLDTETISSLLK